MTLKQNDVTFIISDGCKTQRCGIYKIVFSTGHYYIGKRA